MIEDGAGRILVDFNRANVALMEIVTSPDIRSGEEAVSVVQKIQAILKTLRSSNANMDEVDAMWQIRYLWFI
jgi:aspartyl-tRNA(Asn)/glutamyl-tRNA(Gln) amidotransferase subunit B